MSEENPELAVDSGAVDTHCHLFLGDREPSELVEAARSAGVDRLICVGIDAATSEASRVLAESLPGVFATAGVHPHDASTFDPAASRQIEELVLDPRVIGVGECGLDYFRMHSPVDDQRRTLEAHVELSNGSGKPMVVHVRDAWPDVLEILEKREATRVVIHCFSGDVDIARECARRGYWMSFAGNLTYPKNAHLRDAAEIVAEDRLLVETDSPFLSPQKVRGRDNEPANVMLTIEELARIRDVQIRDLVDITSRNARSAFPALP
ncbi:MAG TPA: TatD family hydrolase [Actinomycetota bacterium]|nr:TatD family hydrolase [Actinomycetota bacterium]